MIHFVMLNVEKALLLFGLKPPHVFSLSSSSSCQIMSWIFIPRVWEVWGNPEQLTWFCEWKNTIKTGLRVNGSWVTALYAQKSRNFFRVAGSRHLHHIVSCHKRDWWTQFSVRFPFPLLPSLMSLSIMHENAQSEEKSEKLKIQSRFWNLNRPPTFTACEMEIRRLIHRRNHFPGGRSAAKSHPAPKLES